MVTKLEKALKRELEIGGNAYVLTITPTELKLTLKGRRKGHELAWNDLISGDAALAVALNASLAQAATVKTPAATGAPVTEPAPKQPRAAEPATTEPVSKPPQRPTEPAKAPAEPARKAIKKKAAKKKSRART